jgi:hypothetical protein
VLFRTWVQQIGGTVPPHYEIGEEVHHRNELLIRFYKNVYMTQYDIFTCTVLTESLKANI